MSDQYAGEIRIYAGSNIPLGWLECNGQQVQTLDRPDLFAIIGYRFGGSGLFFRVPDLTDRIAIGVNQDISGVTTLNPSFSERSYNPTADSGGESTQVAPLPSHTHPVSTGFFESTSQPGDRLEPLTGNVIWASSTTRDYHYTSTPNSTMIGSTTFTGGSQPYNNLQPYLNLRYIIASVSAV